MTTSLEDRIRDALAAQADQTEIDPNAEFLDRRAEHTEPIRPVGEWRRPLVAAAAALVAFAGIAAAVREHATNTATETDIPPVSIVADPPTMVGLPFEVGVGELPAGWAYVDVSESGEVVGAPATDSRAPEDESWFLFRNPASGAAIAVASRPGAHPANEYRDVAEGLAASGAVLYPLDGNEIWFRAAGIDAASATEIATTLTLTRRDGFVDVEIDPSTGFELEWSRFGADANERRFASGQIALTTPNGTATIDLDTYEVDNPAWHRAGVESRIGTTTVYTAEEGASGAYTVTGDPIGGEVGASVRVSNVADLASAQAVFASLRRLEASGPGAGPTEAMMTWDEIADQIAAEVAALPVSARIEIADVVVTEHRGDSMIGACATWHSITRCRSSRSPWWDNDGGARFADVVVDGLWVVIGRVDVGAPIAAPTKAPGAQTAIGVWRPVDTGAIVAYAVPRATDFELDFDSDAGEVWGTGHSRPIR